MNDVIASAPPAGAIIDWLPIGEAPVGPTVMLSHADEKVVTIGYGEWPDRFGAPPRWIAMDPAGFGRFKPTHFAPLPQAAKTGGRS